MWCSISTLKYWFWSLDRRNCQLGGFLKCHYLKSKPRGILLNKTRFCYYRLIHMLQKYIIKLNQCWHKQSGATPRMWGESIKDSCSVLIPYQFQQVGRRAALLGQGPFQQSLPVLVFLTHTWGESKWVFFSSSNNRSASAPSFTLSDLRGAHRFHENATANKFLRDSQIALPGKTFWCIDKINKTIYCAMLKFKTAGALLGATLISCLLSLLKGLFIHNLFVPEVSREEQTETSNWKLSTHLQQKSK